MELKERIIADLKQAMRDRDQPRLDAIRMLRAAIQRREVDDRTELDDAQVLAVIEKLVKQGRDAIAQFDQGGRQDLSDKEQQQIDVYGAYLPEPLDTAAVDALIEAAIQETDAGSMRDMGKVMALLKERLAGRAEMGSVSARVKARLG